MKIHGLDNIIKTHLENKEEIKDIVEPIKEVTIGIQETKLGNTLITSDTKTIDADITEALNGETQKVETTKSFEDNAKKDNQKDKDGENIESAEETADNKEDLTAEQKESATPENIETVTEKLLKIKMESDIDDTQLIDTAKVREALSAEMSDAPIPKDFANMYKKVFGMEVSEIRKTKEEENAKLDVSSALKFAQKAENMSVFEEDAVPEIKYKFLGIAFDTYIIIEIKDEMYMIDQHAAHERIMYEKVRENYYSDSDRDSQMLLLADIVTLSHKEMSIAKENKDMFLQAGFDFDEFGENTIKLTAVPSMCEDMNTKNLFLEILDEMDTVAVTARQEKEDKFIATIACKAAVKGNMKLDDKEVESLLKKLLSLPNPFTCPHGRPTAIKITKTDMEKKFSRR